MTPETTPEVRELYRSAPEGFIAARDILAKRLRDDGHDADAAEVKKLRRPTVAAWSLDRLADIAPDGIEALLDAGAELARAQRATLSGRDPKALREATARRRDLVAELSKTQPTPCATPAAPRILTSKTSAGRSRRPRWTKRSESACGPGRSSERRARRQGSATSRACSWCPGGTTPPDATAPSKARRGARSAPSGRRRACERTRGGAPPSPTRSRRGGSQVGLCRRSAGADGRAGRVDDVTTRGCPREAQGSGVLGVGVADDREARGQGARRGGTQTEGERLALHLDTSPTRTRPGCSTSAYIPNGSPLVVIHRRYEAMVFSVSKSFSPVVGLCVVTTQRGTWP